MQALHFNQYIMKQFFCKQNIDTMNDISLPPAFLGQEVRVIDQFGDPLVGVHIQNKNDGFATITNQNGIAQLEAFGNVVFTFSHIGKETRILSLSEIAGGEVVLVDAIDQLDEVIITTDKPKTNKIWWFAGAFALGYVLLRKKKEPKKVSL